MKLTTWGCGLIAALAFVAGCSESGTPYDASSVPVVRKSHSPAREEPSPVKSAPAQSPSPEKTGPAEAQLTSRATQPQLSQTGAEASIGTTAPAPAPQPPAVSPVEGAPTPPGTPLPGGVRVLVPEKKLQTDPATGALRISFDDIDLLKVLNMDPVTKDAAEKMPEWLKDLDGKQVILRGYMKPDFVAEGLTKFIFVRDTGLCCFGPVPRIYDMVQVELQDGTETDYIELKPFDVVGTFRIEMLTLEDDEIFGLYFFDNARIIRRR